MTKIRLDVLVHERGLAQSRQRAQALVMAGRVMVGEKKIDKPGTAVDSEVELRVLGEDMPFVSRGGLKLAHALTHFAVSVRGRTAMDVGASTGGFSDCLLQAGAARVYAVDVGYGQLAEKLRTDPRLVNMERTNIRTLEKLAAADGDAALVDIIVIDASFISLRLVLPAALHFLAAHGDVVALIKPQFEVGKGRVGKGGLVSDPDLHAEVTADTRVLCEELGLAVGGVTTSPITGQKSGNVEFLIHARR